MFAQYIFVVAQDDRFDICSAAVAQSEVASVEDFPVLMMRREMFVDKRSELSANVVFYRLVIWLVEPNNVPFAVSLRLWFPFSELHFIMKTAAGQSSSVIVLDIVKFAGIA